MVSFCLLKARQLIMCEFEGGAPPLPSTQIFQVNKSSSHLTLPQTVDRVLISTVKGNNFHRLVHLSDFQIYRILHYVFSHALLTLRHG